jgi:ribonucleotide reductase alpha subunit
MYLHAWKAGLKTTYYLRSRPATRINQSTTGAKSRRRRPAVGRSAGESAIAPLATCVEEDLHR